MVRTNVESLIAAERINTQSMMMQALIPLQAENQALKDQLATLRDAQDRTARASAASAEEARRGLTAMREAQEKNHLEQTAAQEAAAKASVEHSSNLMLRMRGEMDTNLRATLFSEDFKTFLMGPPAEPRHTGVSGSNPNRQSET